MKINTPISVGELVDKLTILEIKSAMIKDEDKLNEVKNEKEQLSAAFIEVVFSSTSVSKSQFYALKADLYQINLGLWHIEDNITECERNKDFGARFIRLARDVYHTNDKRFEIKNQINQLTNSNVKEVKSYESYS
jgi:hypothetical protein